MRIGFPTVAAAALMALIATGQTLGADLTANGLWQSVDDDTQQPNAWFLIKDDGSGVYQGMIVRMFIKPGERMDALCDQCSDDRRNRPWLGLEIIRGMRRDGMHYTNGTILDPRNGNIWSAEMTLTPDNKTLVVRGFLGISLLGKNQYWTRLPDSAFNELDPQFNPNRATAATRKSAKPPADSKGH